MYFYDHFSMTPPTSLVLIGDDELKGGRQLTLQARQFNKGLDQFNEGLDRYSATSRDCKTLCRRDHRSARDRHCGFESRGSHRANDCSSRCPRITNNSQEHKLVKIHYRHLTSLNQTSGLRNAGEAGQGERTRERI
jgi:hypothetical protein